MGLIAMVYKFIIGKGTITKRDVRWNMHQEKENHKRVGTGGLGSRYADFVISEKIG